MAAIIMTENPPRIRGLRTMKSHPAFFPVEDRKMPFYPSACRPAGKAFLDMLDRAAAAISQCLQYFANAIASARPERKLPSRRGGAALDEPVFILCA